jgi:glycosyltransferase involved in cell wall biosynthesis
MSLEVSVIIPTFNRRAMVVEAIETVLAQREVRFELIVVDDGSTDDTIDAIESVLESATVPIRLMQTENRGAAAARNLGVEAASSPLIAFLDSDDLWKPEKLSRQVSYMREHRGCAISQCNELWIRNGRRVNPGLRHRKRPGDIFVDSLRTCLISPSAVIMKTDLFCDLRGFDDAMRAAEDYDLWLRILLDHEVGLVEENLVTRRAGHGDQLSANVPAIDRFRILALAKLLANPNLRHARRAAVAEVLSEKCRIYAKGLRRRHGDAEFFDRIGAIAGGEDAVQSMARAISAIREQIARPDRCEAGS